jgi:hypothetical protein
MWWCCGKNKKNAPGCKFQKHLSKEEGDDSGGELQEGHKILYCQVCGKQGHKAQNCERDPNMRTSQDPNGEASRVELIEASKKKHADIFLVTKNLLEKLSLMANERMAN